MVKVWLIDQDDFKPMDVKILASDQVYLIPDANRKKIFIMAGKDCPKVKLYKAGTLATKFKSVGKFYGYEIEKVEESIEPAKYLLESGPESPASPATTPEPVESQEKPGDSQCAPTMTFDEIPDAPPTAPSGDRIGQLLAEIAGIKDLLGKIWQKIKDI